MQEDVFGYLIDDIERFFDDIGSQSELLEYFRAFVKLLQSNVIDLF